MKTARRHELQTNELADRLAKGLQTAKPYGRVILGGVVLVFLLLLAMAIWSSRSSSRAATAWEEYLQAMSTRDRDKLEELGSRYEGTAAGAWARLATGDELLERGIGQLLSDKVEAKKELRRAAENFEKAAQGLSEPLVKQQALFGLARAIEAQGDLAKAKEHYQAAKNLAPEGPLASAVDARLKDIESPLTRRFYDWQAKFEPKSSFLDGPGTPGARPSDALDDRLPPRRPTDDDPTKKIDAILKSLKSSEVAPPTTRPADKEPADEKSAETKPADKKAQDEKPNDEKPSGEKADEKPAETKPAEPKPEGGQSESAESAPSEPSKAPDAKAGNGGSADQDR